MLKLNALSLALCLSWAAYAGPNDVRVATSADTFPYNYGVAEGCQDARKVCGFEIELFDAVCAEAGLSCAWTIKPWGEIDTVGSILHGLVTPVAGAFQYDMVVSSASNTTKRQALMSFSEAYYTAASLFVGRKELNVSFDANGFPLDQPSQALRIGTWAGNMLDELKAAYAGNPKNIRIVDLDDPLVSLQKGEIDLAYVFSGTEITLTKDGAFTMKGKPIESLLDTVGAGFRKDATGAAWKDKINAGLVGVRKKGTYQKISQKWFGRDIWNCKAGPKFPGDGCAR